MLNAKNAGGIAPGSSEGAHSATGGDPGAPTEVKRWSGAMGFPADYKLPAQHRLAVVYMLGNAVCPLAARDVTFALKQAAWLPYSSGPTLFARY